MARSTHHRLDEPLAPHLRTDCARLEVGQSVGEALSNLRAHPPASRIIYFYVVDDDNHLVGVVPTRRLLLSPLDQLITEIMVRSVITLPESATILDACEFFAMHRLLAFPVVDGDRRLLGTVDVELYTDELDDLDLQERSDDLFQLAGVHLAEARSASSWYAFRQRFPWLICNIIGGILAALLAQRYEEEHSKAIALAWFIPIVLTLAESVTIQSVSLAIQMLHGQKPNLRMVLHRLRAEFATGLFLGLACAACVGLVALIWLGRSSVIPCVLAGIAGGVTIAALIGVAMPHLLKWLRREPSVAAGPIALTIADLLTLLVYFSTARWLLS